VQCVSTRYRIIAGGCATLKFNGARLVNAEVCATRRCGLEQGSSRTLLLHHLMTFRSDSRHFIWRWHGECFA
jgi:hypothetical protein